MRPEENYRYFGTIEAHGVSDLYQELALGTSVDADLIALLDELPVPKQQPNLLFAAERLIAGTPADFVDFKRRVLDNRDAIVAVMRSRATQTNEPARCAAFFPLLAAMPQPLALLEVGASAGLCLQPDRYRYDLDGTVVGDESSPLSITAHFVGAAPVVTGNIEVVWRAGIDLNPLDVNDSDDMAWLETLIWPGREHDDRLDRLRTAVAIARRDPPRVVSGDLNERLAALAVEAPRDATLVVFHTSVLYYLPPEGRERFVAQVGALPGHWISQEGPEVFPDIEVTAPAVRGRLVVLALDGRAVALTDPHGGFAQWL